MQQAPLPMPWTFKLTIASFFLFAIGAGIIFSGSQAGGWEALRQFVYGLLTAGAGLIGSLLFSTIGVIFRPAWRRASAITCAISLVLMAALFWVWKNA